VAKNGKEEFQANAFFSKGQSLSRQISNTNMSLSQRENLKTFLKEEIEKIFPQMADQIVLRLSNFPPSAVKQYLND
jgi:hypothetical protein